MPLPTATTGRTTASDDAVPYVRDAAPSHRLLAERGRLALRVIVASTLVFALTDLRLARGMFLRVFMLKLIQIGAAVLAARELRTCSTPAQVRGILLATATLLSAFVALSGALANDITTPVILCLTLAWGGATILPWSVASQLVLALITGLGIVLNIYWTRGELSLAAGYPAVAVSLALAISVLLTYTLERHRQALARENRERSRAETALERARDELEARVRERTAELEAANVQLRVTAQALGESERRFRIVSELTSDYAYAVRIEKDLSATVEWLTEVPFVRITGFTTAAIAARGGGLSLVHPDDHPIIRRRLDTLLAGEADTSEFRIVTQSGAVRWIREHAYAEWDAQQQRLVRIYGAAQDITEQKEAERQVREQQALVSAILDTVGALVGVVDPEGRIVRFNRACERTFGYRLEEVRGRYFWDLLPIATEVQGARAVFRKLLSGQWPTTYDTYWFTRDGERRLLAWSTTFLTREDGTIEYVVGTGIDITDRAKAEAALRASEERFRVLVEQSSDVIILTDADTTVTYVSPSLTRAMGYTPDEVVGRRAFELIHPDDQENVVERFGDLIAHPWVPLDAEFRVRRRDGSWRWV